MNKHSCNTKYSFVIIQILQYLTWLCLFVIWQELCKYFFMRQIIIKYESKELNTLLLKQKIYSRRHIYQYNKDAFRFYFLFVLSSSLDTLGTKEIILINSFSSFSCKLVL